MVKIRKTWHFHSLTLFAVTTLKNKKPLQLQRKKKSQKPKPVQKNIYQLQIQTYHTLYKLIWMIFLIMVKIHWIYLFPNSIPLPIC